MKTGTFLSLLVLLLCLTSGSCKPKISHEDECCRYIQEADRLIELYYEEGDPQKLDSAMAFVNKTNCDKYRAVVGMYKARIYYEKGYFSDAIESVETIPDTLLDFATLKSVLIWELESKWARAEGDINREMGVYKMQDAILRDTITKKWPIYDSTLRSIVGAVRLDNSEAAMVVSTYFYNKSKFVDAAIVLSQIDSMHRLVGGGNPFFEELRHTLIEDPDYIINPDFF